jgi:hypothetical protein
MMTMVGRVWVSVAEDMLLRGIMKLCDFASLQENAVLERRYIKGES